MNKTAEKFAATAKENLENLQAIATKAQADAAKLVELNLETSKAVLAESFAHAKAVLAAKDAQALAALQAGLAKPMAEKATAYAKQVQEIVTDAGTTLAKTAEANLAEAQKGFASMMEVATKNAPAGTESMVAFFNNAMSTSQNAFKTAQDTAKQAVETAQANISAATAQTVDAIKKATKSA